MFTTIIDLTDDMSSDVIAKILFNNYKLSDAEGRDLVLGSMDSASEAFRINHLSAHIDKSVRINGLKPDNIKELAELMLDTFRAAAEPTPEPILEPTPAPTSRIKKTK